VVRLAALTAKAMGMAGCLSLFVMMSVALVDVIARNLFQKPVPAASEIIEITMVLSIFLLYPTVSYKGMHISIDLLDQHMPDLVKRLQHVLAAFLGVCVFAAVAYRIEFLAADAFSMGEVTGVLGIPLGLVYRFISVMSVIAAVAFAATIPFAFTRGRFEHPTMPVDEIPE
jgi:TRAP-type C4-dicarboxylate transport system permease small subunit